MLISDPKERKKAIIEKKQKVLSFLRDETWSNEAVLMRVAGVGTRQGIHKTLMQYEGQELVRRHSMPIVGRVNMTVWGLTPHGLAMSFGESEPFEDRPIFEPSRIALSRVPHQIALQEVRLFAEGRGWKDWVRGERLGFKTLIRPDAIAEREDGIKVAFEIERTVKAKKRYQVILRDHLTQIKNGYWNAVFYVCEPEIVSRVEKIFQSIEHVVIGGERVVIDETHRKRFKFYSLGDWR